MTGLNVKISLLTPCQVRNSFRTQGTPLEPITRPGISPIKSCDTSLYTYLMLRLLTLCSASHPRIRPSVTEQMNSHRLSRSTKEARLCNVIQSYDLRCTALRPLVFRLPPLERKTSGTLRQKVGCTYCVPCNPRYPSIQY